MGEVTIFWFRRDLRLEDNAGLYYALKENNSNILPLFIFDKSILDKLENKQDARVQFIHQTIAKITANLDSLAKEIKVLHGYPLAIFKELTSKYNIKNVYANHDYEPYAISRDQEIAVFLKQHKIEFKTYKDQCIFEKDEILKDDGKPYTIFTPYSKKWKLKLQNPYFLKPYPSEKYLSRLKDSLHKNTILSLETMGFEASNSTFPEAFTKLGIIEKYKDQRDFPSINGTSKLSLHFRFGTISIREKAAKANLKSETWLNELIWRDFYMMILFHFPHVVDHAFKPAYDFINWNNNPTDFELWCKGKTGYPIVDAGMRELNKTGFMHNRVRMIVASFLTKHLLIDWRWGEAYFAEKLLDFDLSANNGGWQWAAGSGCDAAPYFRVFNPTLQTEKFDKNYIYIKKWVPEFGTKSYPTPIVEHTFARNRCLEFYKKGFENANL